MNEIVLSDYVRIILHRLWAVILAAVLFAATAYSYCRFVATPVYSARASILMTNGAIVNTDIDNTVKNTDLAASIYLVDTCVDILKSPGIYQQLSTSIGNKYSYRQLMGGFSVVKRDENSLFIDITFKSTSAEECKMLVNAFAELCNNGYISEIIPSATATVMAYADGVGLVSPRTMRTTVAFFIFGAVVACAVIIFLNSLDRAIKGEEDLKAMFDIPILGTVPDFEISGKAAHNTSGGY